MITPSIYDLTTPAEIMITKNLAYLRMKEKQGQLTPMEKDMLYETHHSNLFCQNFYAAEYLRQYFTMATSMDLNLKDYVTEVVCSRYNPAPEDINTVVDLLLESAASSLFEPVNRIFPCLVPSEFGNMIICYDLRKEVNLMIFDRIYVGFTAFFSHNIRIGVNKDDILKRIGFMIRSYLIQDECTWINKPSLSNPDIDKYIAEKAEEIYTQLLYYCK